MPNDSIQYTSGAVLTVTQNGQFGFNNTNPQTAVDISGVLNLNTGGGINNVGTYTNPPLIFTGGQSGLVGGYSYVVSSGAVASTGFFPNIAATVGQEIYVTNKGGTFTVTGVTSGNMFFNTGAVVSGFSITSGSTRFFFNDGTHWNCQ